MSDSDSKAEAATVGKADNAEAPSASASAGATADNTAVPAVKKVKKKKSLRRRNRRRKPESDDEEDGEDTRGLLSALVNEQKRRARKSGLGTQQLVKGPKPVEVAKPVVAAEAPKPKQYGLLESKSDKVKKLDNLLGGTFTGTTERELTDDDNPFLQKYLEERMGKKEDDDGKQKQALTDEQRLYQVPVDLNPTSNIRADPDDDLGGAPILHGTGIAEVALPMDFKIKCIEDTERARKEFMDKRRSWADRKRDKQMLGSLTANYKQHQHNFIMKVKGKRPRDVLEQHAGTGGNAGGASGSGGGRGMSQRQQQSSDDAVLDRFRKRSRRR